MALPGDVYRCHFDHDVVVDGSKEANAYSVRVVEPGQQRSQVMPMLCCHACGKAVNSRQVDSLPKSADAAEKERLRQQLRRPEVKVYGTPEPNPPVLDRNPTINPPGYQTDLQRQQQRALEAATERARRQQIVDRDRDLGL